METASTADSAVEGRHVSWATYKETVLDEIGRTLALVDEGDARRLAEAILSAERVYLAGLGRSGLVASCFAMRLVHVGLTAHVVGEATAPGLGRGDLLIAASGSGRTKTVLAWADAAKARGAKVAALSADGRSPVARASDLVVEIPSPPYARTRAGGPRTCQPGGTLFEQSLLVFFDGMVLELAERLGLSPEMLKQRHSNVE